MDSKVTPSSSAGTTSLSSRFSKSLSVVTFRSDAARPVLSASGWSDLKRRMPFASASAVRRKRGGSGAAAVSAFLASLPSLAVADGTAGAPASGCGASLGTSEAASRPGCTAAPSADLASEGVSSIVTTPAEASSPVGVGALSPVAVAEATRAALADAASAARRTSSGSSGTSSKGKSVQAAASGAEVAGTAVVADVEASTAGVADVEASTAGVADVEASAATRLGVSAAADAVVGPSPSAPSLAVAAGTAPAASARRRRRASRLARRSLDLSWMLAANATIRSAASADSVSAEMSTSAIASRAAHSIRTDVNTSARRAWLTLRFPAAISLSTSARQAVAFSSSSGGRIGTRTGKRATLAGTAVAAAAPAAPPAPAAVPPATVPRSIRSSIRVSCSRTLKLNIPDKSPRPPLPPTPPAPPPDPPARGKKRPASADGRDRSPNAAPEPDGRPLPAAALRTASVEVMEPITSTRGGSLASAAWRRDAMASASSPPATSCSASRTYRMSGRASGAASEAPAASTIASRREMDETATVRVGSPGSPATSGSRSVLMQKYPWAPSQRLPRLLPREMGKSKRTPTRVLPAKVSST
ncbi:hypothetical protein BU14_0171s0010 [Porphyra umbilicalis]|uniref:Uncharacterized protein n=1 Tax=Porphyra umbilicalis TaxID=2786 RepID=A0A1X6P7J8_PORUM|nr:hypothetical protein BU14_0171s0010 [Porphyra umbilicalis]|eukprot:OSX76861.1 hypothetical protein BU14_0171s0010 [Porphyra umbilicalis]